MGGRELHLQRTHPLWLWLLASLPCKLIRLTSVYCLLLYSLTCPSLRHAYVRHARPFPGPHGR